MRVVIQKCLNASVKIEGKITGKIDEGYVLLVGFTHGDTKNIVDKMVEKIINLRIVEDGSGKLNLSIKDINGKILSISQFTLYSKLNGRRPSFTDALNYKEANELYNYFNKSLSNIILVLKQESLVKI